VARKPRSLADNTLYTWEQASGVLGRMTLSAGGRNLGLVIRGFLIIYPGAVTLGYTPDAAFNCATAV
jgi:hypothetical protein